MDSSPSDEVLGTLILQKLDELIDLLAAMDDEQANRTLPVTGSNSAVQLLLHCCGMMRRWSSTVNLGREVPRDRDGEFQARMPVEQAVEVAREARREFTADLAATDLHAAPAFIPAGRDHYWTVTCQGVLMHVLDEMCQHLGHAEITRDLVCRESSRQG